MRCTICDLNIPSFGRTDTFTNVTHATPVCIAHITLCAQCRCTTDSITDGSAMYIPQEHQQMRVVDIESKRVRVAHNLSNDIYLSSPVSSSPGGGVFYEAKICLLDTANNSLPHVVRVDVPEKPVPVDLSVADNTTMHFMRDNVVCGAFSTRTSDVKFVDFRAANRVSQIVSLCGQPRSSIAFVSDNVFVALVYSETFVEAAYDMRSHCEPICAINNNWPYEVIA